jgi:hypothetical protein
MFTFLNRACPLMLIAAISVSAGGQPPDAKPQNPKVQEAQPYTAFPDLKPAAVALPPLPVVAANSSPLRKVQAEQVREGMAFLANVKEIARLGAGDIDSQVEAQVFATEVYRIASELEDTPAKRVAWYEARVRAMKGAERTIDEGVRAGASVRQNLHAIRFARLQAEADLLRLRTEIEKAGGK